MVIEDLIYDVLIGQMPLVVTILLICTCCCCNLIAKAMSEFDREMYKKKQQQVGVFSVNPCNFLQKRAETTQ